MFSEELAFSFPGFSYLFNFGITIPALVLLHFPLWKTLSLYHPNHSPQFTNLQVFSPHTKSLLVFFLNIKFPVCICSQGDFCCQIICLGQSTFQPLSYEFCDGFLLTFVQFVELFGQVPFQIPVRLSGCKFGEVLKCRESKLLKHDPIFFFREH